MRMSSLPADPLGSTPLPVPGEMRIRGVVPFAQNSCIAVFDVPPLADDVQGVESVTNVNSWSAQVIDPTNTDTGVPLLQPGDVVPTRNTDVAFIEADPNRAEQIHVVFKGPLQPRVIVEVTASVVIAGARCEVLAGTLAQRFRAPLPGPTSASEAQPRFIQEDLYRDFAFEYFPSDPDQPGGTFRYDSSGDIGIQGNLPSLRKRLYRRLLTRPGGFSHLGRAYGLKDSVKKRGSRSDLQKLVNRVAEQARLEPDVVEATAVLLETFTDSGQVIARVALAVLRTDDTRQTLNLSIPVS